MADEGAPKESWLHDFVKCVDFAAKKHTKQRRKDPEKTPYINHPIGVAHILTSEGNISDINVLQAALLHDTIEDTDTTYDEIEYLFGKKVADIVLEVTDNKGLTRDERKLEQIKKAKSVSHEAKLVKLADKLYNLRDLNRATPEGWSLKRVQDYFIWASKVVENLRGTCLPIENQLDILFKERNVLV
ncbi:hypothetical protein HELRODRAFT_158127 [Helobdella robusta]|uniref:Guanosine-3',5'-bis(diphosphate) 3'-pyrophosphohydrolase MESH1 n=1 Tax=Helobdella robusta TaxID=6412 RepID=T1EMJ6_HELRO|nr:hypothetical protein HELRODRAFT_158127 [Helobdella robusta]ESN89887.1 hypothetical protein HELRODRAFT_158127 [Helobdella robusta]